MADKTVRINFEAVSNFGNVINNVKQIQNALRGIKLPDKIGDRLEKNLTGVVASMEKLQMQSKKGFTKPGDVAAYEKELLKADTMLNKIVKDIGSLSGKDLLKLNIDTTKITQLKRQIQDVKKEMTSNVKGAMLDPSIGLKGSTSGMDQLINKGTKTRAVYEQLISAINKGNFSKADAEWTKLINYMEKYNSKKLDDSRWTSFRDKMETAIDAGGNAIKELMPELERLERETQDAMNIEESNMVGTLQQADNVAGQTANQFSNLADKERDAANGILTMNQQMSQLKTQANYFFSLQNMFQLLKRGIQDAFQTVKDLDKAMTETAVVTDFSVGDMWKALPEYTKLANKLGATTQGAYETMTLYYQQGLNKEQAFGLGEETMKMARIAGLDYAETTNMMTAALRGFNMELDNTSAKRINDVYSNLAAKTASDTYELGSAMERTASIAHSANMSFESTTAFLANMIETTREAPENLGTAMKTIVARFQELKENPYEISEVEGEEVNFNRVDKALKTIGVDLVDNRDKFRDLDEVFMDISEKWDGLSQTQQRYIATIAAGSRQQSRFIAMVGNYKRISELVEAANNSAGASNVQFAKTLDSIEAKLNKLKNAWDWFLMGITNSGFLKGIVDFGTKTLTVINDIIGAISGGSGLVKSILSIGTAFAGLKIGGKVVNLLLGGVGNLIDPKGKGRGLFGGGLTGRREAAASSNAKAISNPIVNVLNRIYSVVSQGFNKVAAEEKGASTRAAVADFGKINASFANSVRGGTTVRGLIGQLGQVDAAQQKTMVSSVPGLTSNLRQQFINQFSGIDLGATGTKAIQSFWQSLLKGVKTGAVTWAEALETAFNPQAVGQTIGGKTEQAINQAMTTANKKNAGSPMARIGRNNPELNAGQGTAVKADFGKIEAGLAKTSRGLGNAGQALMSFGMMADQILPGMGGMISTVGMGFTGLGSTISSLIGVLGPLGTVAVGVFGAIGVAVALLNKKHQETIKQIRKDAKDVTKTYEDTTKSTEKNLNTLEEYREDFNKLSKGVDKNGLNINLGSQEYADYKKMVNDIVKMNPALIKGYNAEGQAIIDNNKALEETIKLQKKKQRETTKEYTDSTSLQKLIEARNTYKRWKRNVGTNDGGANGSWNTSYQGGFFGNNGTGIVQDSFQKSAGGEIIQGTSNRRQEYYKQYIDKLKELAGSDSDLLNELEAKFNEYKIDWNNIDDNAVRIFDNQAANIEATTNEIMREHAATSEDITAASESLAKATKESDKFKASYEDVLKNLQAYAGQEGISAQLDGDMAIFFNNALDEIASSIDYTGANAANQMQAAVRETGKKFTDAQNKVKEIMDDSITDAQDAYAKTLDKQQYNIDTQEAQNELQKLIDKTENSADATTRAINEMYQNQLEAIKNFTQEGALALEDALNTEKSGIESANSAYEAFQKSTEGGDLYTGVDANMSKIYEDIMDGVDNKGNGSAGWWKGAEMLLGEGNIKGKSFDQVNKKLLAIKDTLKEGQKGVDAFFSKVSEGATQNKNLPEKLFGKNKKVSDYFKVNSDGSVDVDIPFEAGSEKFEALAEAVGMSSDLLIAQLNKAKQFSDISFTDMDALRKAVVSSDSTVKGVETENGYKEAWMRESTFRETAQTEGQLRPPEIEKAIKDANKKGIKFLKDPDDIRKSDMQAYVKSWTGDNKTSTRKLIESFDKAGYSEDEIRSIYDKFGEDVITKSSLNKDDFDEVYESVQQNESTSVSDIKDSSQQTADNTGEMVNLMGGLTEEQQQQAANYTEQTTQKDSTLNQFSTGEIDGSKITSQSQYKSVLDTLNSDYENLQSLKAEVQEALNKDPDNAALQEQMTALEEAETKYKAAIDAGKASWKELKESMKIGEGETAVTGAQNVVHYARDNGYNDAEIKDLGTQFISENQSMLAGLSPEKFAEVMANFGILKKEAMKLRQEFNMPFAFKVLGGEKLENYIKSIKGITKGQKTIYLNTKLSGKEKVSQIIDNLSGLGFKGAATKQVKKDIIIQAATKYKEGDTEGAHNLLTGATNDKGQSIFGKGAVKTIEQNFEIIASGKIANQDDFINGLKSDVKGKAKEAGVTFKTKAEIDSVKVSSEAKESAKEEAKVNGGEINYTDANVSDGALPTAQEATVNYKLGKQDGPKDKKAEVDYTLGSQALPKPKSATVNYTASVGKSGKSSQKFTLTIAKAARGMNNAIRHSIIPTIGSLAKGTKGYQKKTQFGRVGPNGKGGATLTGEEGYEIGWIPSENRAMILGADGPQVVNLPKEAVVWTHKQSEKIIKQKGIPIGSHKTTGHYVPDTGGSSGGSGGNGGNNNNNGSGSGSGSGNNSNNEKERKRIRSHIRTATQLSVKIFNLEQKIEEVQRKIEYNQNKINKLLEKASTTLADVTKYGNAEFKWLNKSYQLNKKLQGIYAGRLTNLDKSKSKSKRTVSWSQPTWEFTFKKGTGKKDASKYADILKKWRNNDKSTKGFSKVEKKRLAEAKKALKSTKKGTKEKKERVSLSKYIKRDPSTGAYVIDQKAINKAARGNKDRAKAIRDKAKDEIEKNVSGRNSAADAAQEAKDKLDELAKQLSDTFYAWENELTKILSVTTQINQLQAGREKANKRVELNEARLASGLQAASKTFLNQTFQFYRRQLKMSVKEIQKRETAIAEKRKQIQDQISTRDEDAEIKQVNKRLRQGQKANKDKAKVDKYQSTKKYINKNKLNKQEKKEVLEDKAKAKNDIKRLTAKKKSGKKLTKNDKEDLRKAKANLKNANKKLAADKKARKLDKTNSTKSLSKKYKKSMKNLNLSAKTEKKYKKRVAALEKKKKEGKLTKKEKKELAAKKKALRNDAKAEKWLAAYKAKQNKNKTLSTTEKEALKKYREELKERRKNVKTAQKYVKTTTNADGTVSVTLDTDRLERDKAAGKISEELYNFIKDYYDKTTDLNDELNDLYNEQLDQLTELYTTLSDLKDQYADRSEELLDAVTNDAEKNIEKLEKLNDSISNALKDLLDEVKKRLDQRRQQEDNKKTEEEISSKQQRLAALRAGSGNAKEIAALEKEIAEAQQNYQRTLEDQALEKLQDQADEAEKQRERQIKLLQDQLEVSKTNGELLAMVNAYLADPKANEQAIKELWRKNQDYYNKTDARRAALDADWAEFWADIQPETGLPAKMDEVTNAINQAEQALQQTLGDISRTLAAQAGESGKFIIDTRVSNSGGNLSNADMSASGGTSGMSAGRWAQKEVQDAGGSYTIKDWFRDAKAKGLSDAQIRAGAAGMETSMGVTGTYKGQEISASNGHVNTGGTRIAAAQGDKVYFQKIGANGERQEITGYYDINAIDPVKRADIIEDNKAEFTEAFKYAVTHQNVGTKINKNTQKLVRLLGVAGKEYKLNNGIYGSISSKGNIHYNNGVAGVKVWYTSKGSIGNVPFSKKNSSYFYKNRQQANIKREYDQVNEARKKANQKAGKKKYDVYKYKKGGLATTTGPAWLDGTKSKPELVLNAKDTANFIALKNVLSRAVSGMGTVNNSDTSNYEINVNVDKISNDYDVDKMIARIKKQIVNDANYRNVNAVRNMR